MSENGTNEQRRERLRIISDALLDARNHADDLHAHMLAAKIEDSRICAQDMIDALR